MLDNQTPIDNDSESTPLAPEGGLAQVSGGGSKEIQGLLTKQIKGLEEARTQKKAILDKAISNLQSRLPQAKSGPSAEELFRLSAAFGAPTRTGSFGESLANVSGAGADILKARRESESNLQDLMQKYQLQGIDTDADYLKQTIDATKALATTGGAATGFGKQAQDEGLTPGTPQYQTRVKELYQQSQSDKGSPYGKIAKDEGLSPGTPAFSARVKELAQFDIDAKEAKTKGAQPGNFDTKTGNFVTDTGTVIGKAEIAKDREERQKLLDQKAAFKKITNKTLKEAESIFDVTGAGATGAFGKGVASKLSPTTLRAQSKIVSQAIEGIQKALPPGPASDKDVAQAKATFPGFGDKKALKEWLTSLEDLVDRHLKNQDIKYGTDKWYGSGGAPTAPPRGATRNELGETVDEQKRLQKPPPSAPKVGAILHGHKFLGGDPSKEENWKKV